MTTKYEAAIQKQIERAIESKRSSAYFEQLAERAEADADCMAYGNKAAATREARRCRIVAAALKKEGL